jgi:hypothetical protein
MRRLGPNARTILGIFDEGVGGLAAPASIIGRILEKREYPISKANLLMTLDRLATGGHLAKIPRLRGGAVYTRPRNLANDPTLRARLELPPDIDIRQRDGTTDRRYELRKERALKALGDEAVRKGGHEYRYNYKQGSWYLCYTCGRDESGRFGKCRYIVVGPDSVTYLSPAAGVQEPDNASASHARSGSRARKRDT